MSAKLVSTPRRGRRPLTFLVVAACSLALAGTSHAVVPRAVADGTLPVCGGLTADARFVRELGSLGRSHACEHLRLRRRTGQTSPWGQLGSTVRARVTAAGAVARAGVEMPRDVGRWSAARSRGATAIGITAVLLHTGNVLLFGRQSTQDVTTTAYVYDPRTGDGHPVDVPAPIFCGSVTPLPDGRILSVGGSDPVPRGIPDLWIFDPVTETWSRAPDTPLGRYYPTSTLLPDGRVVVTAGRQLDGPQHNPTVEVFTPPADAAGVGTLEVVGPEHTTAIYPHQLVMPDGNMLQVDRQSAYVLNPATWVWRRLRSLRASAGIGAAHLMLPGPARGSNRVMMIGGTVGGVSQRATHHFDYSRPGHGWTQGNPMPSTRSHMNVVQVPDGSAYGIGGNGFGASFRPRRTTLHYDPATDGWRTLAAQTPNRTYHSTAVLLPDGRILSAGDDQPGGGSNLIDVYRPPYLFKGRRPQVTRAPQRLSFRQRFRIRTEGSTATRAVLMAPGATTHANEMHARHVRLAVRRTRTGLRATAPRPNVAPPGYYMLFVLNAKGVPSVARWVHLGR